MAAQHPVAGAEPQPKVSSKQDDDAPLPPITPGSTEDIHTALIAASREMPAMHRLIDPEWGIGTYDPGDTGVAHHCETQEFATHPGLAFTVHEHDRFRCDRERRRCSAADPDGGGYSFYFRAGAGDAVWLDTIVHHTRTVPGRDSGAVRAFANAGDGVCSFRRALGATDASPPRQFSVFVASHTGLVEDTVSSHLCGDEADAANEERLLPNLSTRARMLCTRNPSRCGYRRGDEQIAIYGAAGGPTSIAITRPGMFANLEREQDRELQAFLRGLARHSCDE